jgi:nucleotide-binding universal stress UspA family protein
MRRNATQATINARMPVLPSGIKKLEASRVLIAWKDTREARRAVSDVLPLLKDTESVIVAAVGPKDLELQMREQVGDVATYLERRGVTIGARVATATREAEVHVLLGLADERKVDLIVAGAYGRSRARLPSCGMCFTLTSRSALLPRSIRT